MMLAPKYPWPAKRITCIPAFVCCDCIYICICTCVSYLRTNHSPEERRILELLVLLKGQNRVAAVKNFEEYFFENRPRMLRTIILMIITNE
jgi:hypothetical protein